MQVYQRYRDDLPPEHVYVDRVEVEVEATERSDKAKKLFQQGFALHKQGKLNEARSVYEKVLSINPKHFDMLNMYGIAQAQLGNFKAAADLISRAIAINPNHASFYNNRGGTLLKLKQSEAALVDFKKAIQLKPDLADAHNNQGLALRELEQYEAALASFEKAIQLKADYADAYNNRGLVLLGLKQPEAALASIDKAIQLKLDYVDAYINRGCALMELKQLEAALASHEKAIELKPDYVEAHLSRGNALLELRKPETALVSYEKAIQLNPNYAEAYRKSGNANRELRQLEAALASYETALALKPDLDFLLGELLFMQMYLCDWRTFQDRVSELSDKLKNNLMVSTSFPTLALTDVLVMHYKAAYIWSKDTCPSSATLGTILKSAPKDKIRIGYYSSDFHNHATAYLMAELFERHDKSKFEVIAFSFGPSVQDAMRQRLEAAFSQFIDVRLQSDKDVAQLSRTMGIDIAIDLKGYTADSRPGIFSYRAAPIQISYLGYPGTMAAEYIDYLIADPTLVPVESQKYYSEKIIYLPDSYQVNDRQRVIADTVYTRDALGLPPEGFVFCCFNNNYKITPPTFDGWMRILHAVPGGVLWLLEDNATAAVNLRKEAQARGIDSQRLVFAKRMDLPEHLARHRAADLFIDTLPYNAHTTASDALWAGLPVLTCMGESFASRVAGSLLNAIGMPELVPTTQADYEALAIDLALNPAKLAALKAKLEKNRLTTPLFDTPRFTKHIETAYMQVYQRYRDDLPPEHVYVNGGVGLMDRLAVKAHEINHAVVGSMES
jgi:predicted O-linked N-acetylglucosamine transferase (SPINDLY family)